MFFDHEVHKEYTMYTNVGFTGIMVLTLWSPIHSDYFIATIS